MEKILTVNNVADILQVKAITVREMFREKRLRGFKVGKAWRTTEAMLQEDIDTLAQGKSPEELPTPAPQSSWGKTAPVAESIAPPEKPARDALSKKGGKHKPTATEHSPETAPGKPQESTDSSPSDDDTQQMLF